MIKNRVHTSNQQRQISFRFSADVYLIEETQFGNSPNWVNICW
ncbi:hypothetical protein PN486_03285 [Nodularia spumigena CS-587/03]|nr:hypothetical protein [Nodularia spumigena CS-587/03]